MYWRHPFRPLATAKQLVEYVVLDIQLLGPASQKHALAEVQVTLVLFLSCKLMAAVQVPVVRQLWRNCPCLHCC